MVAGPVAAAVLVAAAAVLYALQLPGVPNKTGFTASSNWRGGSDPPTAFTMTPTQPDQGEPERPTDTATTAADSSVIIDCDPALGVPRRDIDDALALLWVLHHNQSLRTRLAGVTTVFGNAPLAQTHTIAEDLVARWLEQQQPKEVRAEHAGNTAREVVKVYRGASKPGDTETAAVEVLAAHRGVVVLLGPCTNAAAALARGAVWSHLIVLGGTTRPPPNIRGLRTTELNFALDEWAAEKTLELAADQGIPVTLFPMEVCRRVLFTATDLKNLPAWLQEKAASWLTLAPLLTGRGGFHPWDLLPVIFLQYPSVFRTMRRRVAVLRRWWARGHVVLTKAGGDQGRTADGIVAQIVVDVDEGVVRELFREASENATDRQRP